MIKLTAIYTQTENGRWDAEILGHRHITVKQAEDLETARIILRIITAEEVAQMSRVRANWDIVEERIYKHVLDDDSKTNLAKGLLC